MQCHFNLGGVCLFVKMCVFECVYCKDVLTKILKTLVLCFRNSLLQQHWLSLHTLYKTERNISIRCTRLKEISPYVVQD